MDKITTTTYVFIFYTHLILVKWTKIKTMNLIVIEYARIRA